MLRGPDQTQVTLTLEPRSSSRPNNSSVNGSAAPRPPPRSVGVYASGQWNMPPGLASSSAPNGGGGSAAGSIYSSYSSTAPPSAPDGHHQTPQQTQPPPREVPPPATPPSSGYIVGVQTHVNQLDYPPENPVRPSLQEHPASIINESRAFASPPQPPPGGGSAPPQQTSSPNDYPLVLPSQLTPVATAVPPHVPSPSPPPLGVSGSAPPAPLSPPTPPQQHQQLQQHQGASSPPKAPPSHVLSVWLKHASGLSTDAAGNAPSVVAKLRMLLPSVECVDMGIASPISAEATCDPEFGEHHASCPLAPTHIGSAQLEMTLWDTHAGKDGFMGEIVVNVNKRGTTCPCPSLFPFASPTHSLPHLSAPPPPPLTLRA